MPSPVNRLTTLVLAACSWRMFGGQPPPKAMPAQPLIIRLYNLANVPSRTLDYASRDASRILSTAGIEALWHRRDHEREAHTLDLTVWKRPAYGVRDYIVVGISSRVPVVCFPGALGYALPDAEIGVNATIFYDRIQRLSEEGVVDLATVLGHVMAHEIGHVLLGSTEHCRGGIMKATWSKTDFQISRPGTAEFTPQQCAAIRKRISSRKSFQQTADR